MLAFVTSHLKTFLGVPSRLDAAYSPGRPTYPLGFSAVDVGYAHGVLADDLKRVRSNVPMERRATTDSVASLTLPGIVLGMGLGGFVDGILLHQLLQWHHMLTSIDSSRIHVGAYPADTVHGLRINTVWDGLFHTFTWLSVLIGLGLLYSRLTHSRGKSWTSRALWGWVLAGWGMFNLVEGIIDHQILGIHHVRTGEHQTVWDIGFLALGAVLVVGGWLLQRSAKPLDRGADSERSVTS
jgi:uncharacterized membrane protein